MLEFWQYKAACYRMILKMPRLASAWITESGPYLKEAKEACFTCPVRIECLASALTDPKAYGVRGGFFFKKGTLTRVDAKKLEAELGIRARTRQKERKKDLELVPS